MGACVSTHASSHARPAALPASLSPQSADELWQGPESRLAASSYSDSSSRFLADTGLLMGNKRSSLSADVEQMRAVLELPSDQRLRGTLAQPVPQMQQPIPTPGDATDAAAHSTSAAPHTPPPSAPVAVYRSRDDDDDDSDADEAEDDKVDELELISEEQVFAAACDSFDDEVSLTTAPIGSRRMSLLASAPVGSSISASLSSSESPFSMERRLTLTVSVGSFHVLLVDEDPQHAELIARWLRKKQFVVTVCTDGEEAVSLMQEIYEVSRAHNSQLATGPQQSERSLYRASVSASAIDTTNLLNDVDLIICDACMSGSADGQPFLDHCKQSPAFAHIPIVLMSVDVESAAVNRSINRGAYDHWPKPLARSLLQNTVRIIREGKKEERKASLLREWGDRYKQTMLEERKAAIGQGHQPHTLSVTPLTALRSVMLLTPLAPSGRSLPPVNGAMGGWSAAASYGQFMAHEGRTFAALLHRRDDDQQEHDRLREWLNELHVEHSAVETVASVHRRVERMVRSRDDAARKQRGRSVLSRPSHVLAPVARISEEKEAEQLDGASGSREEADKERMKGIIGMMRHHRSHSTDAVVGPFADRDVDLLIVDMDGLDEEVLADCHLLLEKATDKAVSIIVLSGSCATLSLPSHADIDAMLQKPVRKETFCTKVSAIIARRQARLHSSVLAQRAEGYKEMVDKIRHKRASQMGSSNGSFSHNTSPPSKTASVGAGGGSSRRHHDDSALDSSRARSGSQPDERSRGEKMLSLDRAPSMPLAKMHGEEEKEASDEWSPMRTSVSPPVVSVQQPVNFRAVSAQHRLQQLDTSCVPPGRRTASFNKPLEHGSLRTPRDEESERRLSTS